MRPTAGNAALRPAQNRSRSCSEVETRQAEARQDLAISSIYRGDRKILPRLSLPRLDLRARAAPVLGRAQGGVPGGWPHLARLVLPGRHPAPGPAPAGAQSE